MDKTLSKFSLNIFNMYKLLTGHWRDGVAGAESLGKRFTRAVAEYVQVYRHHSTLGTDVRRVNGKLVWFKGFETADAIERYANAMTTLYSEEGDAYRIKFAFRDRMNTQTLKVLPVISNSEYDNAADEVMRDELRDCTLKETQEIQGLVIHLKKKWDKLQRKHNKWDGAKILVELCNDYYDQLKEYSREPTRENSSVYRAFQILLVSGMRLQDQATVTAALYDPL